MQYASAKIGKNAAIRGELGKELSHIKTAAIRGELRKDRDGFQCNMHQVPKGLTAEDQRIAERLERLHKVNLGKIIQGEPLKR